MCDTTRRIREQPVLRIAVALALILAGGMLLRRPLTAIAPSADDFYSWGGPLGQSGQLLHVDDYDGTAPEGPTAKRILYTTT